MFGTDVVTLQRRDHDRLKELLDAYAREPSPRRRRATFRELVGLVTTHAFAEETVLFPAARRLLRAGGEGDAVTAAIEGDHQRINELLAEMDGSEPGDPGFESRADELFPLLLRDLGREEDALLPRLASSVGRREREALGTGWAAAKRVAPNRAHPGVPRRPPANALADLPLLALDRARDLVARVRGSSQ